MSKRLSNKKFGELLKRLYPEKYIETRVRQALKRELKLNTGKVTMAEGMRCAKTTIIRVLNKHRDLLDLGEDVTTPNKNLNTERSSYSSNHCKFNKNTIRII